jgi:hypothetical protein
MTHEDEVRFYEAAQRMLRRYGGPKPASAWEVSLNMRPGECRDGAMVPGSQGLLVFRTVSSGCPPCRPWGWGGLW